MIRAVPGQPSSQAEDSLETVGNLRLWRSVFNLSFSIKSSSYKQERRLSSMFQRTRTIATLGLLVMMALTTFAQRPRMSNDDASKPETATTPPAPAPQTVKAKYEGGVFGYPKKLNGTLTFDDTNQRLLFRNEQQKEVLFVPYNALTGAYGDTHSVQPKAASIGSHVPYVGYPIGLIKTKVRYLTIQYNDPDSKASGVTSFRLENKDLLDSVLNTLANKAGLTRRGEVFIKKKE